MEPITVVCDRATKTKLNGQATVNNKTIIVYIDKSVVDANHTEFKIDLTVTVPPNLVKK